MEDAFAAAMTFVPPLPDSSHHLPGAGADQLIVVEGAPVEARFTVPRGACGVVAMVHASSTGRIESRHTFAAEVLQQGGLATLEVDLLTFAEEERLLAAGLSEQDEEQLAERIAGLVDWLAQQPETHGLKPGLWAFGAAAPAARRVTRRPTRLAALICTPEAPAAAPWGNLPALSISDLEQAGRGAELATEFFARHVAA